jgi:cytochrome c oxidase subunit 1
MGWAIGGIAAVIDSTVAVNTHFHNTLWVPAHFHTYYLLGVVLMILGTVFHLVTDLSKLPESGAVTRTILGTVVVGGYGFVLMLYLSGVAGVPRRYSVYPGEVAVGTLHARISLVFIAILLVGAIIYIAATWRRSMKALSA